MTDTLTKTFLFLTTADTETLAAARAVEGLPEDFPSVLCANPVELPEPGAFFDEVLPGAGAVVVRLLGGRRAWPEGFEELRRRCAALGVPLLAFGGEAEPDAEIMALSTAPGGVVAEAFAYLRHGGVGNTANLFLFLADTLLLEGYGFERPSAVPEWGVYHPRLGENASAEDLLALHDPAKPTVGVVFYRAHLLGGNTAFVDDLVAALEGAGANALPVYSYSLRADAEGGVPALALVEGRVDCLVTTVLASGGSNAGDAAREGDPEGWLEWEVPAFERLGVPVVQGICTTGTRERWLGSDAGLSPLDTAWQVAIPEFDGRIISVPFSFKERRDGQDGSPVGAPLTVYVTDPERTRRLAGIAVRHARLARIPNREKRVAVLLSNYPTKHSRVGNAVGLDTPRSAVRLLEVMREAGYAVEGAPDDGDALIHTLIASGGHDLEFLSEGQLNAAAGRLDVRRYERWFAGLPEELRDEVREHWGPPPGDLYRDGNDLIVAGLRFGNVFVGIQAPRGFGENPIAIYHDPDLPPTHHYLAAYLWLVEEFGADALMHLGKHGTLEWLPGKSLGLSPSCAPDAALGDLPLFYPFVVNDPGEGTQAKRRAHACVVDHLIPPLTRADTYDDLAKLEQLLDEYYQVETLDPSKLPAIRVQIWETLRDAELHNDLGVEEPPEEFGDFLTHVDGYLCEIKDLPIRGGLHVLGEPPTGEPFRHLVAAIMRLGDGHTPGLRASVAAAFGLDERALRENGGARMEAPEALSTRLPGIVATSSDLLDRMEEAVQALLLALEERRWDARTIPEVCEEMLGFRDEGVERSLRFAVGEVVPRLARTPEEMENLLSGLSGGYVPAGPSGSPTRGLVNVLPTGRNFYSVDPKALPSRLSWEVGQGLAGDLLARYLEEEGRYPESVGIVVWGTAAMRTQGDDIAEILALLGVRPVWNEESRRVIGLDVISLEELGRPRIDVTVRISGFFRDAFPNLIQLLDDAFALVAKRDEPPERNAVRRHFLEEMQEGRSERRATARIFGSKPGAYGAGLLPLMDARNWRDDGDLAEVYAVWGGYAYGRGLEGVEAQAEMEANLRRTEVAVKNIDNREHDLFDSDDYFQYHGGMIAAVRALTGRDPKAYIGDSADPSRVKTRDLSEEARRVFRSRVANPKWIEAMQRHGYKGAFELSATVDYLFGYDATANVVEDWMYRDVTKKYVLDEGVRDFMHESNPWALRAISERLLEAADRGLWANPDPEDLEALKAAYLENEGMLEERT
jgi:cobaltochelatase CobN